jgi:hypothetical protein
MTRGPGFWWMKRTATLNVILVAAILLFVLWTTVMR